MEGGDKHMRWKLIQWEKNNGYKSKFVAEKVGVPYQTWRRIKIGKQSPTLEQLESFRNAFHIEDDVFELFKEE